MVWSLGDLANLVTVVTAIGGSAAALRWIRRPWSVRPGAEGYSVADIRQAMRWYVEPDVLAHDPSQHDEPADVDPAERKSLFKTMDQLLSPASHTRYVILLGDSGMGKTAALVNYYVRSLRRLPRPYRIAIAPLTQEHVVDWIRAREDKSGTLLLLDALDEFVQPGDGIRAALQELAKETSSFAKVVISCRSQYFANDEELPAFAEVVRRAPRPAGAPPHESIERLYIAPLNDKQIKRYLARRFPLLHRKARRHARSVIARVPRLSVRPMLLSFLDDIGPLTKVPSMYEIYEQGVHGWLHRECAAQNDVRQLRQFSTKLAAFMWVHQTPSVEREEALRIAREMCVTMDERRLSGRSLLNRDGVGRWKFAHRSIMEFLLMDRLWEGQWSGEPIATDQMRQFFMERLGRKQREPLPFTQVERDRIVLTTIVEICRFWVLRDPGNGKAALDAIARLLLPYVKEPRAVLLFAQVDERNVLHRVQPHCHIGEQIVGAYNYTATNFDQALVNGVIHEEQGGPTLWQPFRVLGQGSLLSIPVRRGHMTTIIFLFFIPPGNCPGSTVIDALSTDAEFR